MASLEVGALCFLSAMIGTGHHLELPTTGIPRRDKLILPDTVSQSKSFPLVFWSLGHRSQEHADMEISMKMPILKLAMSGSPRPLPILFHPAFY